MKSYKLLYPKNWRDLKYQNPQNIKVIKGENLDLSKHPEIKKKIEEEWNKRKLKNRKIFSNPIYRLSGYSEKNDNLLLELGETCYKELVGTNYISAYDRNFFSFIKKVGFKEKNPYKYFSMALSVGTVIETKDGYILITRRSEKVESYKNTFHTIAGQTDPRKFQKGPINFKISMADEIGTEAGLKENEYKIYFTALVMNNQNFKPELIFVAKSRVNLVDILLRKKTEAFEAKLMFGLKKKDLNKFLNSYPEKEFCPPGLAAWQIYLKIEG
jgi:hypothetical protein